MDGRRLWIAGCAIWLTLALELALLAWFAPDQARGMAAGLGAELLTGREGGVPVGLAAGAHPLIVWQTSFLQDLGTAFLGYPVFLWLIHRYHGADVYLMRRLRLIEQKAAAHERYARRWGPLGIGAFMMLPFLVNGPFIGLILGRITGIHTMRLLGPVIVATVITAALWTFFFDTVFGFFAQVGAMLPAYIAAGAVAIVVALAVIDFVREHRALRGSRQERG